MKKIISSILSICMLSIYTVVPIKAEDNENILLEERFESSTGGFSAVSNVTVSEADALSEGMSDKVLEVTATQNAANKYIQYQKVLDEKISSQEYVSLEFDIAAQYRRGKDHIYFGAYDSGDNEIFLLDISEGNTEATLNVNGIGESVPDMKPNVDQALSAETPAGKSYHIKAVMNFFAGKQRIIITPTTDTSDVLLDKTYDIEAGKNLSKLGMPVGKNWTYGKIHVDNLTISAEPVYSVSFSVTDNNFDSIENAYVTVIGGNGMEKSGYTSSDGQISFALGEGSYQYTILGNETGCSSIASPVEFSVNSDTNIPVSLIKYNGPTASSIDLISETDYIEAPGSGEKEVKYIAVIKDQYGDKMDSESVSWQIDGAYDYMASDYSCTIRIPSDAETGKISVKAISNSFDYINQTKVLYVSSYKDSLSAQWIWLEGDENNTPGTWLSFRKDFYIEEVPSGEAFAKIAADSKYWLYINGTQVVFEGSLKRGPNQNDSYYDYIDIAPYLRDGENTICALVWYFGKSGYSHIDSGQGGFLFDLQTEKFNIFSNGSWKVKRFDAYGVSDITPNYRLSENNIKYDARLDSVMTDWKTNSYDDSAWSNADSFGVEGSAPWNNLIERPIPMWKDDGIKLFDSYTKEVGPETTRYTCYLPTTLQITPYFKINAQTEGKVITIKTNTTDHNETANSAQYVTKEGEQSYESLGWLSGYIIYFDIPNSVDVIELGYRNTSYDSEVTGSFISNDEFYNELWKKSVDTLKVTMRDNFMDCPDRERAQWWGDAVIESQMAYYSLDENALKLISKGIHNIIDWRQPGGVLLTVAPCSSKFELPVQVLAGLVGYYTHYLYTGDESILEYTYPYAVEYLNTFTMGSDGVVNHKSGSWDWTDWGSYQDNRLITNGWYYMALDATIKSGEIIGNDTGISELNERKISIENNYDKVFWNDQGFYRSSGVSVTDDRANALAVLSGLASEDKYPAILTVLKTTMNASPYMEKYVLEAMYKMGYANDALIRMKSRYSDMVNSEIPTLWELWTTKGGTTNHAWSGGPLTLLSMYGAGVAPIEAGYKSFRVIPQPGVLTAFDATVPSVKGNIDVSYRKAENGCTMKVTVPDDTNAVIGVPRNNEPCTIEVNGNEIYSDGSSTAAEGINYLSSDDNYVYFNAEPGEWSFTSTEPVSEEPEDENEGINIALYKTVTANNSLTVAPSWLVSNLTDGIQTSGGSAKGYSSSTYSSQDISATPNIITIDMEKIQNVNRVILYPRTDTTDSSGNTCNFPVEFTIEVSSDGLSYNTVKTVKDLPNPKMEAQVFDFDRTRARYVRITTTKTGNPASDESISNAYRIQLSEIEIYNCADIELKSDYDNNTVTGILINNSDEPISAHIYIAVYDKNDILVSLTEDTTVVNVNEKAEILVNVKEYSFTYQIFAWDENQKPIAKSIGGTTDDKNSI